MLTVYGIKQCDTVRKALRWLDGHGADFQFHDLRVAGFSPDMLDSWLQSCELDTLLNRRSTTWRKLDETTKANRDIAHLKQLLLANPTLVKRPVFVRADTVLTVGFAKANQQLLETML